MAMIRMLPIFLGFFYKRALVVLGFFLEKKSDFAGKPTDSSHVHYICGMFFDELHIARCFVHICIYLQFRISHIYIHTTFLFQFFWHSSHIFRWISRIYTWNLIVASWLIRIWDPHPHMWGDSFPYATWLIPIWDMTQSYMRRDSILYVTWLIRLCDVTHSHSWHDASQYENDSFPKVTWLIHKCGMIHSYVTWLIRICDITHLYV